MIEPFIARCRAAAAATYLGDGRLLCSALGRFRIVVDAGDMGLTPNIACDGFWEPGISVAMAEALKPGMVAVDIGANVGYFTLLMVDRVGPAGKVVAIEANPALAELVRETIVMNGLESQVTLHNLAASDAPGSVDFFIPPGNNLNSGIVLEGYNIHPSQITRIEARTVDSMLEGLDRVDLVKIDVEGAEHMVVAGMRETIRRNPGITIILEYNNKRHEKAGTLIDALERQGFALREIGEDGSVASVERASLLDPDNYEDRMLFLQRADRVSV